MKCTNCALSLLCYTERFMPITREMQTYLCPKCKKLIHLRSHSASVTAYAFFCEKCTLTPEIEKQWERRSVGRIAVLVNNPLDKLNEKRPLVVMQCPKCTDMHGDIQLKWVELE